MLSARDSKNTNKTNKIARETIMLSDLYLIKHSGEYIFHLCLNKNRTSQRKPPDEQLFSGFLSALMAFNEVIYCEQEEEEDLKISCERRLDYFSFKDRTYYVLNTNDFYLCLTNLGNSYAHSQDLAAPFLDSCADKLYSLIEDGQIEVNSLEVLKNPEFEKFILTVLEK